MASDYEITYLGTDDELESVSSAGGEEDSKEGQRWSLTEGMPPSLPIRSKSPAISGGRRVVPPGEIIESMFLMPLSDESCSSSSNTPVTGSLDGEMAKIAIRDVKKLPRLVLHDDDSDKLSKDFVAAKAENDCSERSARTNAIQQDDANDHWSPLRSDDYNDYSPPTLPKRRGSGDALDYKVNDEQRTLSTLPDYEDEEDDCSLSHDCDKIPPPPFDK